MEIRHLRSFAAAAERESFTQAAQALNLTQAAISQHVAALEKRLSVPLFERTGRTVKLTTAGKRLLHYATEILELVDRARQDVSATVADVCGTIRIASSTVPAECFLPQLLAKFRKLHPQVREVLQVSDSDEAVLAVEQKNADVGFVGELPATTKLDARPIANDRLVLVVSPDHPWAKQKQISPKKLCQVPLIVREPGSASRRCVELGLTQAGISIDSLNIAMEISSNESIRAAVQQGLGVAFLSQSSLEHEIDEGRLASIRVTGVKLQRHLYLITKQTPSRDKTVQTFLAFLDSYSG